jgi:hypothetical protein
VPDFLSVASIPNLDGGERRPVAAHFAWQVALFLAIIGVFGLIGALLSQARVWDDYVKGAARSGISLHQLVFP